MKSFSKKLTNKIETTISSISNEKSNDFDNAL